MSEGNLIVRKYETKDYVDIIGSGYPYDTYLKPKFFTKIKTLFNKKEIHKFLINRFIFNREQIALVAYSKADRKAVGLISLRKFTKNLWAVTNIFVSPLWRGERIASMLYQESFKLLKRKGVKKTVATVSVDNSTSVKSIERNWQGFLNKRIFKCVIDQPIAEHRSVNTFKINIKTTDSKDDIFEVYRECTGEEWCNFLEIDENNFMDRIFGMGYFESVQKNLLTRLIYKKDVLIAEQTEKLKGFAIIRVNRSFLKQRIHVYLFVLFPKDLYEICHSLFEAIGLSKRHKVHVDFHLIHSGKGNVKQFFEKLGFKVDEKLIPFKYL